MKHGSESVVRAIPSFNGIYSSNGFNPNNEYQLILALHPFYKHNAFSLPTNIKEWDDLELIKMLKRSRYFVPENRPEVIVADMHKYTCALNAIIADHHGPIITLEQEDQLEKTVERYERLGKKDDCYFIKTKKGSSELAELTWDGVLDFLNLFQGRPWLLAGGYLEMDDEGGYAGCLGDIIMILTENWQRFDICYDAVFSFWDIQTFK